MKMKKRITKVCALLLAVTMMLSMTLSAVAEGIDDPADFPSHIIAAAETSLLSELGLTVDQFREKYGSDMDLSELQLAYFAKTPIPAGTDASQAGEGVYLLAQLRCWKTP